MGTSLRTLASAGSHLHILLNTQVFCPFLLAGYFLAIGF